VVFAFSDFTLETGTRRLLRDGSEAHLSPKAFDLLAFLVTHGSRAVSKGELHEYLWPSTHVLDTSLASLIAEVRRALGDSADQPRYVRTVHRFGYWFIGQMHESARAPGARVVERSSRCWLLCDTRQVALTEGENILGRAPDAAIWIDAPGVSRRHARIRLVGPRATVEDLGSKNGTFLKGQRVIAPSPLADGDQIRLGTVVVTFRVPPSAESTDAVPPARS
jgi:DNA-binding winged helix-turn-helix (wHTH) protein